MNRHSITAVVVAGLCGIGLAGCEDSSSAPPSATGGAGLSEEPTTLLGRSAKRGKDVAAAAENRDAQAAGLAGELSGEGAAFEAMGLRWVVPTAWTKEQPASSMRLGQFRFRDEEGEALVVFSTAGGTVEQNIDRWSTQVTEDGMPVVPVTRRRTVAGLTVHVVEMEGTYLDLMAGVNTPQRDYGFRGAIIEKGGALVFIKMTGPKAVMDASASGWEGMIRGMVIVK